MRRRTRIAAALAASAAFAALEPIASACTTDADCSGSTPVCNPVSSLCVPCQGNFETDAGAALLACPDAQAPACQLGEAGTIAGECTQCSGMNSTLCTGSTPVCVASAGACGCVMDMDCADPLKVCNPALGMAGQCVVGCKALNGGDTCPSGEFCQFPDGGTVGTCQPGCKFPTDCLPPTPICDTTMHACVECLMSSDCVGGNVCDTTSGSATYETCVACTPTQTQNCSPDTAGAACLANDTCGCTTDSDCGGPNSGRVCLTPGSDLCSGGCRGTGGNGCPVGEVCSSSSHAVGQCTPAPPADGGSPNRPDSGAVTDAAVEAGGASASPPGSSGGCSCSLGAKSGWLGAIGVLLLLPLTLRRRRCR